MDDIHSDFNACMFRDGCRKQAADNAALRERVKVLEDALRHIERVMGPKVPPCCDGCHYEWGEALKTVRAALAQPAPAVQVVLRQPNLFAADPAAPAVNCEWTNCPRRVGDVCCNDRPAAPAVPAVQIGMKASTWETLSSDAQTLILEAGQRAVDKAKAQRLADAAARGGMAQIPLDGSAAAPAVREPLEGAVDPDCNYIAPMGKVCNKCGRIHRGITGDGK